MRLIFTLAVLIAFRTPAFAKEYYVSASGHDDGSGAQQQPWRTLDRASRQELHAGDRLLLEAGSSFPGTLILDDKDRGEKSSPIVVTSYGEGRAILAGGAGSAITLTGCRFVAVRNLRLTGAGRKTGNTASGVLIRGGSDIELDGIEVSGFQHSGIEIRGVDHARLTHIHAHENGAAGISSNEPTSHDVYIGYSLAENNPGDPTERRNHSGNGIMLGAVERGLIEYSEARYNGWDMAWTGNGPVGIWAYQSDRVVIQFCVSHHNRSTAEDGGGFDFDGGMTNSILQYNYSHDNFGTGYLICQYPGAAEFANNVVRYNISQDDGLLAHNSGIYVWVGGSGMKSTVVHNNTIFNTKGSAVAFSVDKKFQNELPQMGFYNNLFISRMAQIRGGGPAEWRFAGNLYWSVGERGFAADDHKVFEDWARTTGQEVRNGRIVGKWADPLLRKDGPGLISSPADLGQLHEYRLLKGSPAIDAGLDLRAEFGLEPGTRDFFGAPTGRDIGAVQAQGGR